LAANPLSFTGSYNAARRLNPAASGRGYLVLIRRPHSATNKTGPSPETRGKSPWIRVESTWIRVESTWIRVESAWIRVESTWIRVESTWIRVESPEIWVKMTHKQGLFTGRQGSRPKN
jgi:hypothetical protein